MMTLLNDNLRSVLLRRYLSSEEVRRRQDSLLCKLDALVKVCLEKDETELGFALILLGSCHTGRYIREANDALIPIATRDPAESPYLELVRERMRLRGKRLCRECGCSDACACVGGCRWVESDLCSACAPPSVDRCRGCGTKAPGSYETEMQLGWVEGVCHQCQRLGAPILDPAPEPR